MDHFLTKTPSSQRSMRSITPGSFHSSSNFHENFIYILSTTSTYRILVQSIGKSLVPGSRGILRVHWYTFHSSALLVRAQNLAILSIGRCNVGKILQDACLLRALRRRDTERSPFSVCPQNLNPAGQSQKTRPHSTRNRLANQTQTQAPAPERKL
jgi:hypothetical protein